MQISLKEKELIMLKIKGMVKRLLFITLATSNTFSWANFQSKTQPIVFGTIVPHQIILDSQGHNVNITSYLSKKLHRPVVFKHYTDPIKLSADFKSGKVLLSYGKASLLAVLQKTNAPYTPLVVANESYFHAKGNISDLTTYPAVVVVNKSSNLENFHDLKKTSVNLYVNSMTSTSSIAGYVLALRKLNINPQSNIKKIIDRKTYTDQIRGIAEDKNGIGVIWKYTTFFPKNINSNELKIIDIIDNLPCPMLIASNKLSKELQQEITKIMVEAKPSELSTRWVSGFSQPTNQELSNMAHFTKKIVEDKYIMNIYAHNQ